MIPSGESGPSSPDAQIPVRIGSALSPSAGDESEPEAVGVAALFAVAVGFPLAVTGFVLGTATRRVVYVFADGSGRSSTSERL